MNKKTRNLLIGLVAILVGAVALFIGVPRYQTAESINASDPMFYVICTGLILAVVGVCLTLTALLYAPAERSQKERIQTLVQAALFAALSYVGFQFFRIDIPVGAEKTAFHLGNTFVVLGALMLGGSWGGLSGAIGLSLADLTSGYVTSMPKTFLLKLLIGLIAGTIAHKVFHINEEQDKKKITLAVLVSSIASLGFNVVADPVVGYFYKMYLFGIPQDAAAALAKMATITTFVNAALSVVVTFIVYMALRPALNRSHLLTRLPR